MATEKSAACGPDAGTGSAATSSSVPTPETQSLLEEKEQKLREVEEQKRKMMEQRRTLVAGHLNRDTDKKFISKWHRFVHRYYLPKDWFEAMTKFVEGATDADPGSINNRQFFTSDGVLIRSVSQEKYTWVDGRVWWVLRSIFGVAAAIVRRQGQPFYSWPAVEETCSVLLNELKDNTYRSPDWLAMLKRVEAARGEYVDAIRATIKEHEKPIAELRARLWQASEVRGIGDVGSVAGDVDMSCAVCMVTRRTIVFKGCRHCCTCKDCADQLWNCPVCNARITGRERVYL